MNDQGVRRVADATVLPVGKFFGETLQEARFGDLVVTEVRTPARLKTPLHFHEWAYLELVLEGRWLEACGSVARSLEPYLVIYHPRSECHRNEFSPTPGRSLHVELNDARLERLAQECFDSKAPLESRSRDVVAPMLRLIKELYQPDRWSRLAVEGLVAETASLLGRDNEPHPHLPPPGWLGPLTDALRDHVAGSLTLTHLAEAFGVHPSVLTRTFRQHYGCVPSEFVRRIKVERAASALADTDSPLTQIALQAGFSDQSHLTRVFRYYTGTTPAAFRRRSANLGRPRNAAS